MSSTPAPPLRTPFLNKDGTISLPWLKWLQQIQIQVANASAPVQSDWMLAELAAPSKQQVEIGLALLGLVVSDRSSEQEFPLEMASARPAEEKLDLESAPRPQNDSAELLAHMEAPRLWNQTPAHTITLLKLTGGGANGSITWNERGEVTGFVDPT